MASYSLTLSVISTDVYSSTLQDVASQATKRVNGFPHPAAARTRPCASGNSKRKTKQKQNLRIQKKLFFLFEDFSIKNIATTGFDPVTPGLWAPCASSAPCRFLLFLNIWSPLKPIWSNFLFDSYWRRVINNSQYFKQKVVWAVLYSTGLSKIQI